MSTQTLAPPDLRKRLALDRRFYLIMAVAAALVIFVGFSRSYYLKFQFPAPPPALTLLVTLHGAVFTAYVLYFITQTALIAVKRPRLHRRLGLLGAALAAAMLVLGLAVAYSGLRLGHGGAGQDAEVIFLVGLVDLATFAGFFTLGHLRRRDREAHQRLMLLAVILGLTGPGIGRLGAWGVPIAVMSLINFFFIFAGPVYDFATRRRIHPVYGYGALYALATFTPIRFLIGATPWWHSIAHRLTAL